MRKDKRAFGTIAVVLLLALGVALNRANRALALTTTFLAHYDSGSLNADYAFGLTAASTDGTLPALVDGGYGGSGQAIRNSNGTTLKYALLNNLNSQKGKISFKYQMPWSFHGDLTKLVFSNPRAVYYDAATEYYIVLDASNNRVVKTKADGTGWVTYGSLGSGAGQFNAPEGLDYDPDTGYIYIADTNNNRIVRTKIDGAGWAAYGTYGYNTGNFRYPRYLDVDPSTGDIYVSDSDNNRIVKTKIDGTGWATYGSSGISTGNFRYPRGISYDASTGYIYVADYQNNRIVKTKIDGTGWATYGSSGSGTGQFSYPYGVRYNATDGYLYITDYNNSRIVKTKFDGTGWTALAGSYLYDVFYDVTNDQILYPSTYGIIRTDMVATQSYGTTGSGTGKFTYPRGVDYDAATGYYYVADYNNHRIVKTQIDGTGWTSYGSSGRSTGQFYYPYDVSYDHDSDYVYVADYSNSRIVKTKMDGTGWAVAQVASPQYIDYDPNDDVVYAVSGNTIYKLTVDCFKYGSSGSSTGQFYGPTGFDYDPASGYYYIADTGNNRIIKTQADGTGWTAYGTYGSGTGQFNTPRDVAYDASTGYIYVIDRGNRRIVKTQINGTGWTTYGTSGSGTGNFSYPEGIDYDVSTGDIYVADTNNARIVKTKIDGTGWTTYGSSGSGTGNFSTPRSIQYDSATGDIYVADYSNYRIVKTKIDGTGWTTYGSYGTSGTGKFSNLNYVSYDAATGYIYAADSGLDVVVKTKIDGTGWTASYASDPLAVRYNSTTDHADITFFSYSLGSVNFSVESFGSTGSGTNQFSSPAGIAYDSSTQYLYIADTANHRIVKTQFDGTGWATYGSQGLDAGQFYNPAYLYFDAVHDHIYVYDSANNRVIRTKIDGTDWQQSFNSSLYAMTYDEVGDQLITMTSGTLYRTPFSQGIGRNRAGFSRVLSSPYTVKYDSTSGYLFVMNYSGTQLVRMKFDGTGYESLGISAGSSTNQFSGALGVDYDAASGYIYVSDTTNNRIIKTKMDGTGWTTLGTSGSGVGNFSSPRDIKYDATTGFIYVADYSNNRIVKTKIDGSDWVSISVLTPKSVTLDGDYLEVVSATSPYLFKIKNQESYTISGLGVSVTDMQYDTASGYIYIVDYSNNRIVKSKTDGTDQTILGSYGSGAGQFYNPKGIYYDAVTEYLYIADYGNNRVIKTKIDGTGWATYAFASPNDVVLDQDTHNLYVTSNYYIAEIDIDNNDINTISGLSTTYGTAYDPNTDYYYIADYNNRRIIKTKLDGTGWETYGSLGSGVGQFNGLRDIVLDPDTGYLYIADTDNNRIVKTQFGGTGWTTYGSYGSGTGYFRSPYALDYDPATGYIYVADYTNYRIIKTKIDGTGWTAYGSSGSGTGNFNRPTGISYDPATDYVYVADYNNNRIVKTQFGGTGWTTYGSYGSSDGQFNYPLDVTYDAATDYVYVADYNNNRLVKTKMDGTGWAARYYPYASGVDVVDNKLRVVAANGSVGYTNVDSTAYGSNGSGVGNFSYARNLDYDSSTGYLYIADYNNSRIVKTKIDGTGWTTYGTYGTSNGQFRYTYGLTYDPTTGYIYVGDYNNSRMVRVAMDGSGWLAVSRTNGVYGVDYDPASNMAYIGVYGAGVQLVPLEGLEVYTGSGDAALSAYLTGTYYNGYWYLSESNGQSTSRIIRTNFDGSDFTAYGSYGSSAGQFYGASNFSFDTSTGYYYLADTNNGRIVKTQVTGAGWSTISSGVTESDKALFATNGTQPLSVRMYPEEGKIGVDFALASGGINLGKSDVLTGTEGDWYTMDITYDNTTGIDVAINDETVLSKAATWSSFSWGDNFYIGNDPFSTTKAFTGLMDDVQISSAGSDVVAPSVPNLLTAKNTSGGATDLTTNTWYNYTAPYFTWSATDNSSGVKDYLVYFGTDSGADPMFVGTSQTAASYSGANLTSGQTYYLIVRSRDNAANMSDATTLFTYKYDSDKPQSPTGVVVDPPGNSRNTQFEFTWPTAGDGAGTDTGGSGVLGYQYRIQNKAGDYTDWSDVNLDGTYTFTIPNPDTDYLGTNRIQIRAVDNAGNVDDTPLSNNFYYSAATTAPRNLSVNPEGVTTVNTFSFDWDEPSSYPGQGYYYSVNVLPTVDNKLTVADSSLSSNSYASQQGKNTLYVLAADGQNTNYDSCATISGNSEVDGCSKVDFYAETPAPGYPQNLKSYDISNRDTEEYAVALKWSAPDNLGTGFDGYNIYRSLAEAGDFSKIGASSGTSYIDDGLQKEVPYFYQLKSKDNTGQTSIASSTITVTPTGKYTKPPLLKEGSLSVDPKAYSAVVRWTTYRQDSTEEAAGKSSSFVLYGTSRGSIGKENGGKTVGDPNKTEDHSVTLTGLDPETTYYMNAMWEDVDGNQGISDVITFTTKEKPVIANVTTDNITLTSANINWSSVNVVSARVSYCSSAACGEARLNSAVDQTTHTINISGLQHTTNYTFTIYTTDIDGNVTPSDTYSFATLTMPQIEGDVKVDQDTAAPTTTYRFRWNTNIETSTILNYLREGGVSLSQSRADYTKEHDVTVSQLADQSKYIFEATGVDQYGNKVEKPFSTSVTTPQDSRSPKVTNLSIEVKSSGSTGAQKDQIVASWETDEPSTSQIEYAPGMSGKEYSLRSKEDAALTNYHVAVINELEPSKMYHLRAVSKDAAGNPGYSDDTTAITGRLQNSVIDLIINSLQKSLGWLGSIFK